MSESDHPLKGVLWVDLQNAVRKARAIQLERMFNEGIVDIKWWQGMTEEQLAKRCDELVAEKEKAVLEEARWWHQRLHRALGIPCDMETLEECSRMDMLEGISDKPSTAQS